DIPLKKMVGNLITRWKYLESLGYNVRLGSTELEEDENGELNTIASTWIISREGITAEISNDDLVALEREIDSFIEYKFSQIFKK
ncbi:MAG: hypothetical protein KBT01_04680, partial [Clostridiales bacterium]|nr:hypothetical protein [Candidatus Blautia equi]